jgi:hypothetical protein
VTRRYSLIVASDRGTVVVQERPQHRLLPESCPQRHINYGGSFCIGLCAGDLVQDESSAADWWTKLSVFLRFQETAHEIGEWPPLLQLSHGDAADIQLAAERLAEGLGLLEVYKEAVAFGVGPIAVYAREVSSLTGRLRNSNARCVCGWLTKHGRTKKRWQCAKDNDPCLPLLEAKRQKAERAFWNAYRNQRCCGTMRHCPLMAETVATSTAR